MKTELIKILLYVMLWYLYFMVWYNEWESMRLNACMISKIVWSILNIDYLFWVCKKTKIEDHSSSSQLVDVEMHMLNTCKRFSSTRCIRENLKENTLESKSPVLYLCILLEKKDTHGNLASTLFDKRDDFNFSIVVRRKIFLQFLI